MGEIGPGDLLLSFDVTVTVGGITATDEDLVRVHGGVFSLFFDGSAAGIDPGLDLDAAYILASNGHLLLAFDGSGTLGGVSFTSEDVLEFTPTSTGWALAYDGLAEHSGWVGADLHGLSAVDESAIDAGAAGIRAGSGGGAVGSGLFPGSKRVFGMGTPNAVPDNSCIAIYAVGPNGVPDHPPGSIDDQLLGTGGVNASGLFVDEMGNPGIPLETPLRPRERIFAVDVCQGLVGQVATVLATQAPAASTFGLAIMVAMLALIGLRARSAKS